MEFAGTWFVVMESEKVAVAALDVLRHCTLHDQAVKARLKNESYLKNLLKALTPAVDGIPAEFVVPTGVQPMMFMNYNGQAMMMPVLQPPVYGQSTVAAPFEGRKKGRRDRKENREHKRREHHPRTYSQPKVLPRATERGAVPAAGADGGAGARGDRDQVQRGGDPRDREGREGPELPAAGERRGGRGGRLPERVRRRWWARRTRSWCRRAARCRSTRRCSAVGAARRSDA